MQLVFFPLIALWTAAALVKSIRCVVNSERYTYSMWDGGMLRAGRSVTPVGAGVKIGTTFALGTTCIVSMTGIARPYMLYAVIIVAIASLVLDSVFLERS
jgi:hypothetical protein